MNYFGAVQKGDTNQRVKAEIRTENDMIFTNESTIKR